MDEFIEFKNKDKYLRIMDFDIDKENEISIENKYGEEFIFYISIDETKKIIKHLSNCLNKIGESIKFSNNNQ